MNKEACTHSMWVSGGGGTYGKSATSHAYGNAHDGMVRFVMRGGF